MAEGLDPRLQNPYRTNLEAARRSRLRRNLAIAGVVGSGVAVLYGATEDLPLLVVAGVAGLVGQGIHTYLRNRDARAYDQQANDVATLSLYEEDFPESGEPPSP